jgi:outer membrane immunogenic protein
MVRACRATLAAFAVIGFASVASAADMPVKAPARVAAVSWTGWYAGVNIGGAWDAKTTATFAPANAATAILFDGTFPTALSPDPKGLIGGGQIGYDWQISQWLLGLEADFQGSGYKGTASIAPFNFFNTSIEQHSDWFGTFRARLGFLPTPNLLIYGTGGLAYGQTEVSFSTIPVGMTLATCPANFTCAVGASLSTRAGWAAGAGLEYMFSQHWTARAEYLYVDLGSQAVTAPDTSTVGRPCHPGGCGFTATAIFHESIARFALNYKM